MLSLRLHKFSTYFSVLHCIKIKVTHTVAPVNLHLSINVTGVSRCVNVCPIVLSWSTYFQQHHCEQHCYSTLMWLLSELLSYCCAAAADDSDDVL